MWRKISDSISKIGKRFFFYKKIKFINSKMILIKNPTSTIKVQRIVFYTKMLQCLARCGKIITQIIQDQIPKTQIISNLISDQSQRCFTIINNREFTWADSGPISQSIKVILLGLASTPLAIGQAKPDPCTAFELGPVPLKHFFAVTNTSTNY